MDATIVIYACKNNHHFLMDGPCPQCHSSPVKTYEYRDGDCIACGCLCPENAYACNNPSPIKINK